jgi:hypothetical protein
MKRITTQGKSFRRIVLEHRDLTGTKQTVSMMGFRQAPGEAIEVAKCGGIVDIEKQQHHVASLVPPPTVIYADGTWEGERPLTMGLDLGSENY